MDLGGLSFTLITVVGVIVLGLVIVVAMIRNRGSGSKVEQTEEATRRVYEEEEREHHGESDNVP